MTPLVPPTPSPLFPPNLSILVSLGPDEVKALVREYGLTSDNDDDGAVDDDDLPVPPALLDRFPYSLFHPFYNLRVDAMRTDAILVFLAHKIRG